MQQHLQILKINEKRSGTKDGRDWQMQTAECVLLNEKGEAQEVGVLTLTKDMMEKSLKTGRYVAEFQLRSNYKTRQIQANLVSLTPVTIK